MSKKNSTFARAKEGDRFQYDGELFVKTGDRLAWSIRNGRRFKEWAFRGDEQVVIIIL